MNLYSVEIIAVTIKHGTVASILVPASLYNEGVVGLVIDYDVPTDTTKTWHRLNDGKPAFVTVLPDNNVQVGVADLLHDLINRVDPMYRIVEHPHSHQYDLVRKDGFIVANSSVQKYLEVLMEWLNKQP